MDFQVGGQRADRRKRLPGQKLAADERLLGRENYLVDDGLAGLELEPQRCHMDNVTDGTLRVKLAAATRLGKTDAAMNGRPQQISPCEMSARSVTNRTCASLLPRDNSLDSPGKLSLCRVGRNDS